MNNEIITGIISAIGAGGLTQFFNWRINRKKGKSEIKAMEIENIKAIVDRIYEPLINKLNERIQELESEVKTLRTERDKIREEHQKEIAKLQKQILDITKALGMKATEQLRDAQGRWVSNKSK